MSSMTFFFLFVSILAVVFLVVNLLLAPHNPKNWSGKSKIYWDKLSNSGELLKFKIPSHIWKYMSGWTNYSGMVISQKMSENEMGYRGSKLEISSPQPKEISVNEQRVDGSYFGLARAASCVASGAPRQIKIKVYSNGLRKQLSSQNPF